jgi:hypothetical protein
MVEKTLQGKAVISFVLFCDGSIDYYDFVVSSALTKKIFNPSAFLAEVCSFLEKAALRFLLVVEEDGCYPCP